MVDTTYAPGALATDIYDRIGVRTVINCRGATTAVGGSLMRPEVTAAMVEASKAFVVIDELNAKVGEVIAEITGAEAGYVTAGFGRRDGALRWRPASPEPIRSGSPGCPRATAWRTR